MKSAKKLTTILFMAILSLSLFATVAMAASPVTNSAVITPGTAYTNDTLVGNCNVTDADNDSITYYYTWYVNGTSVATTQNLSSSNFVHYDNVTFSCLGNDGTTNSTWTNSTVLTISNTLPVANTATISPSTIYNNDTVEGTCNVTDLDGDSVTTYYTWYVNGVETALTQNLSSDNISNFDEIILSCNGNDQEGYSNSVNSSLSRVTVDLTVTSTEFDDSITTNFSAALAGNFLDSVPDAVIGEVGVGKITYSTLDASTSDVTITLDLDSAVEIDTNSIYLNASALPSGFNTTAVLTFYGLSWDAEPIVNVDDVECTECTINSYDAETGTLVVTVPHFSTYTTVEGLSEATVDSCQNTRGTLFAALALIALFFIVGAGFALTKVFDGGDSSGLFLTLAVSFIGIAVVLMVGFVVISRVALSVCIG